MSALFQIVAARPARDGKTATKRFAHSPADIKGLWKTMKASTGDSFSVSFNHLLSPGKDWILSPIVLADVDAGQPKRNRFSLGLRFLIEDPRLPQACRSMKEVYDKTGTRGLSLTFTFYSAAQTWGTLFAPFFAPGPRYSFSQPVAARMGLERAGEPLISEELQGGVLASGLGKEEGKNFFIFDCHSHWHPFALPPYTECHGWVCSSWSRPARNCLCIGLDSKAYPQCNLFRCCFCDTLGGPTLA